MAQGIARLFAIPDGDDKGTVQATAVSLVDGRMGRKLAQGLWGIKINKTALEHLALPDDEKVAFLSDLDVDQEKVDGTLLQEFETFVRNTYPELTDKTAGLFVYLYMMHRNDVDKTVISGLAQGVDAKALRTDLQAFFDAHINPDSGSEIIRKAGQAFQALCRKCGGCPMMPMPDCGNCRRPDCKRCNPPAEEPAEPAPEEPAEPSPAPAEPAEPVSVATPVKTVTPRACTPAYYTKDIVEDFRNRVGLARSVSKKAVAQFLLAVYLPSDVTNTTAFSSLAYRLRIRPHHMKWAKSFASQHPELSSHCWQSLSDSLNVDAQNNGFVSETSQALGLPCYATKTDKFISAMAVTQFNMLSLIKMRIRATNSKQVRRFR